MSVSELEDLVRQAAGSVTDPELRKPLGELGMIGDVAVVETAATITVKLTIVGCPASERISSDVLAAVLGVDGIDSAEVVLTVMTEEERTELLGNLRPGGAKVNPFEAGSLTRVIAITSGKGGVGKSSVTANLAIALTQQGYKVGILDADVYGFSIPALMGLEKDGIAEKPTRIDDMIVPPVGHDVKVISIGMFVENNQAAVAWRGPMLQRTITQFLTDVYFGNIDFLLLDLPPGTGDVAITVGQQLPHAEVLVITTGQSAASDVAVRAGVLARQTGQQILGVVENMGPMMLPDGSQLSLFGEGGADEVATKLSIAAEHPVDVLARIPLSQELREGGDEGIPLMLSNPESPAALAIAGLATQVARGGTSKAGINLGVSPKR
jgi:ATP-binding protein involved in chromosome partitioning